MLRFFRQRFTIGICFDWIRILFSSSVLIITLVVTFYSTYYMSSEKYPSRFIWLVIIFVLSIILLILRGRIFIIFLGWDGLGVSSFFLVAYYLNTKRNIARLVTILTNRIGDVLILFAFLPVMIWGGWSILDIKFWWQINLVSSLVIVAAFTKRAQFPFSSWLPAAMAAPTPVSSLVHSSTLVTAGIFILIRFYDRIILFKELSRVMFCLGWVTLFYSGLAAFFESDFKKIIALSTLSQLGFIVIRLGLGTTVFCFFHLLSHAFFKSLLFLCAGIFIHQLFRNQDFRKGLIIEGSSSFFCFIILSGIGLIGLGFSSGFFRKELIVEFILLKGFNLSFLILFLCSILLTFVYSIRLIIVFMRGAGMCLSPVGITIIRMWPLTILGTLTVCFGRWFHWNFLTVFSPRDSLTKILLASFVFLWVGWTFPKSSWGYFTSIFFLNHVVSCLKFSFIGLKFVKMWWEVSWLEVFTKSTKDRLLLRIWFTLPVSKIFISFMTGVALLLILCCSASLFKVWYWRYQETRSICNVS